MTRILSAERRLAVSVAILCALAATVSVEAFAPAGLPAPTFVADVSQLTTIVASARGRALSSSSTDTRLYSEAATDSPLVASDEGEGDDEEEWEYVEFENLAEEDFYGSEWKVGTVMEDKPSQIKETWARLITQEGENVAVWGDGSKGKWNFDVPSQFLSISKESFGGWLGKKIWAGVVDDYYYLQGSVRGWSPISPASVLGQWQAKRLGVDPEEMGTAPWFQSAEEEDVSGEKTLAAAKEEETSEEGSGDATANAA